MKTSLADSKSVKPLKDDRRTTRTRRSLHDAIIELILEKHYDEITVQDVIDRADVGRSTFYAHYRDKEDLFLASFEVVLDHFVEQIHWENAGTGRTVPVLELFQHVQEFQEFCRALARSRKMDIIFKTGVNYLAKRIEDALAALTAGKQQPSVPLPILSNYLAGEIFSLLRWWVEHNTPYSPERMDEVFHQLVMPGFGSALGRVDIDTERKDFHNIHRNPKHK